MVQPVKKSTALKNMLRDPGLHFLMEAHNGLSAKIAEEAGFQGIWGSGLSISAALGVRDNNEASWTQVLEVVEFMADATTVPILLDGDTGYGNFNSARRLVTKLEQRGIAGVCIEDKLFPKTNSFIRGTAQPLADMHEHAGKIRAMKEAQRDEDFVVVARVEALIAGHGMEEAIKRGEEYRKAGADAVLIHSSKKNAAEILQFKKEWGDRLPLVIVPTKYYTTPTEAFREAGFKIVIWANHLMRSALATMQATARQIFNDQSLINVEEKVATIAEVFRLQGEPELEKAEKAYLPSGGLVTRGIILAAGRGLDELGELVKDKPKTMLPIGGKPILGHILDAYRSANVRDLVVVRGFAKETVNLPGATYVDNDAWSSTGEAASLAAARTSLEGAACLVSYGDVMFKKNVLDELLEAEGDFVIAVDSLPVQDQDKSRVADWVIASEPHSRKTLLGNVTLKEMARTPDAAGITGEWTGILKTSAAGGKILSDLLAKIEPAELAKLSMQDLLRRVVKDGHTVKVVYSRGGWLDVNTLSDVVKGSSFR